MSVFPSVYRWFLLLPAVCLFSALLSCTSGFPPHDEVRSAAAVGIHPLNMTVAATELQKPEEPEKFPANDHVTELIRYMNQRGFDLETMLKDPRFEYYNGIGDRFRGSPERNMPTLDEYKELLQFEDKKSRVPGFVREHEYHLIMAEESYGISRYVIASILAVESDFGRITGRYNPLNVYVSMVAENYRSAFARAQLEELLEFVRDHNLDVHDLNSSYAGAMSAAQFIPYSLNRWWVGDNITDMSFNIFSVANYLAHFKNITGTIEGAVHRYNPSTLYTGAVLDMAREAEAL